MTSTWSRPRRATGDLLPAPFQRYGGRRVWLVCSRGRSLRQSDPDFQRQRDDRPGERPGRRHLGGTLTATAVDGVATFSGLTLNTAGTGYTLEATASGLKTATTSDFNVVPAAPTQLLISSQPPSSVTAGDGFGVSVAAEDPFGNPTPTFNGSVTIALASGPDAATLGGTLTATAVDGVATFSGLTLNTAGAGYTLEATASGLAIATTSDFNLVPAAPRNW